MKKEEQGLREAMRRDANKKRVRMIACFISELILLMTG